MTQMDTSQLIRHDFAGYAVYLPPGLRLIDNHDGSALLYDTRFCPQEGLENDYTCSFIRVTPAGRLRFQDLTVMNLEIKGKTVYVYTETGDEVDEEASQLLVRQKR